MESSTTNPQAIELDYSCSGQAHFHRPITGHRYENAELGCALIMLLVPSVCHSSNEKRRCLFQQGYLIFRAAGINGYLDLSLSWRASENLFKRPFSKSVACGQGMQVMQCMTNEPLDEDLFFFREHHDFGTKIEKLRLIPSEDLFKRTA